MAGVFSPEKLGTDYLTAFVLHRTVTQSDSSADDIEQVLDLSRANSARNVTLLIIPKQISGTPGRIKFEFYVTLPNPPPGLAGEWILIESSSFLGFLEVGTFDQMLAGTYRIRAICETPGTAFEIYIAHNQYINPAFL